LNRGDRRARLNDIRHVAETLRAAPIDATDFTSSILDRVDAERPFLAPSVRRRLPWVRITLGACVAVSALGLALVYRWAPSAVQVAAQPAPISDVVQCVECARYKDMLALRTPGLNMAKADAGELLAAVVKVARLSEGEGRPAGMGADQSIAMSPIPTVTQVVPENVPVLVYQQRASYNLFSVAYPPQSMLSDVSGRPVMFSADVPKVKVVPTFLEHDLDGVVLPR